MRDLDVEDDKGDAWSPVWAAWSAFSSVIGALGMLNLMKDLIELKESLRELLAVWDSVVGPIADALFGWIRSISPINLPAGLEDYLTLGVIVGASTSRAAFIAMRTINRRRDEILAQLTKMHDAMAVCADRGAAQVRGVAVGNQRRALDIFRMKYKSVSGAPFFAHVIAASETLRSVWGRWPDEDEEETWTEADEKDVTLKMREVQDQLRLAHGKVPGSFNLAVLAAYWPLLPAWPVFVSGLSIVIWRLAPRR